MRRNLNKSKNGRRVLDKPKTGELGSTIPSSGQNGASFLFSSVNTYSLQTSEVAARVISTTLPSGTWVAERNGVFQTSGSIPDGRYDVNYDFSIFGRKQPGLGQLNLVFGSVPPFITSMTSFGATAGQTVTLSVTATGTATLTYQWQRQPSTGGGFIPIGGATSNSYTTPATTVTGGSANHGDEYRCIVTNPIGSVTSLVSKLKILPATSPVPVSVNTGSGTEITMGFGNIRALTFTAVDTATVNIGISITIENTGAVSENWSITPPANFNLSISSGTVASGATTTIIGTATQAGTYTLTLTCPGVTITGNGQSVMVSAGIPAPAPSVGIARNAGDMLFQPVNTRGRTVTLTTPHLYPGTYVYDIETDSTRGAYGPSWQKVDGCIDWMWANAGGDWIDSNLTQQGTTHWAVSTGTAANGTQYSTDITALVNYTVDNDKWLALICAPTVGARTIAGRHSVTHSIPVVDVVYEVGGSASLACTFSGLLDPGSTLPNTFGDASGNIPISSGRGLLEFNKPTGRVSSAVLKYVVTQHFGGSGGLSWNLCSPPIDNTIGPIGVAASSGLLDLTLEAVPGVIGTQRLLDSATESDFISTALMSGRNHELSPEFWGGSVNTSKLPYVANHSTTGKPRWINAKETGGYGELSFVNSSYSGEGFSPLAPGLGAIKVNIPRNPGVDGADGYIGPAVGTTGSIAMLFLPPEKMGLLQHLRVRFYARWHLSRPLTLDDRRLVFSSGGSVSFTALSGKWGITGSHDCTQGGVSGTSGAGWGWQHRMQYKLGLPGNAGPDFGKFIPGIHIKSDYNFKALDGYQYSATNYTEQLGKVGGYGGTLDYDTWFLVELDVKLNSVTSSGLGYIPDGHYKVWINDKLVLDDTAMAFRSLPLNPGCAAAIITPSLSNIGNGTLTNNAVYNGGINQSTHCFPETLTITLTSPTTYSVTGSFRGSYGSGTVGTMYATNRHRFTVNAGGTPYSIGDTFTIVHPPYVTDLPAATIVTPMRELGFRNLWLNHFHGGLNDPPIDITTFYTGIAWADGDIVNHIGPMVLS